MRNLITIAIVVCALGCRAPAPVEEPVPAPAGVEDLSLETQLESCRETADALATRVQELERAPESDDYWDSVAKLVSTGEITKPEELSATVAGLSRAGLMTADDDRLESLLAEFDDDSSPSPFQTDRLRVLIVAEQTGEQPDAVQQARAFMSQRVSGEWRVLDDDVSADDLSDQPEWVRLAYAAVPDGQDGKEDPWLVIGAPDYGFSGQMPSFDKFVELTRLED